MKHDPPTHLPAECERCQRQLSEMADSGEPLTSELQAHLAGCDPCAQFAEQWLPGPPAILTRSVSTGPVDSLRERILRAAGPSNVVRFPTPVGSPSSRTAFVGRIAACLALAGFAYWLLNPTVSHGPSQPAGTAGPTLTQGLLQMEDGTKREQRTLQAALVDGSRQVSGDVAWSMSALEL